MIERRAVTSGTYTGWTIRTTNVLQYRVRCPDGRYRRTAWLAEDADTMFSRPAAVRIGGRYTKGFVTVADDGAMEFRPYA